MLCLAFIPLYASSVANILLNAMYTLTDFVCILYISVTSLYMETSTYPARWLLRYATLLDNYRLSSNEAFFSDEMYSV